MVLILGHAIGLAMLVRANDLLRRLFAEADRVALQVLAGERPFAFAHLADMVGALILREATLTPTKVLLMWVLVVRLTRLAPGQTQTLARPDTKG